MAIDVWSSTDEPNDIVAITASVAVPMSSVSITWSTPSAANTYTSVPSGVTATAEGASETATVATTVFAVVSITETESEPVFVT